MTKHTMYIIAKTMELISLVGLIAVVIYCFVCLVGCSQQEYRRTTATRDGVRFEEVHIKLNSLATDTAVDSAAISKLDGTVITIDGVKQDNDSVTVVTPGGVAGTNE